MLLAGSLAWAAVSLTGGMQDASPFFLRPQLLPCLASGVAALAGVTLPPGDKATFLHLHLLEAVGFVLGFVLVPRSGTRPIHDYEPTPNWMVTGLFRASVVAALLFVAWQGVPILAGNVEGARVEAAASGTGYLRLTAYMAVPAALVLISLRAQRAWVFAVGAGLIVLALANRSPLIYLLIPLALASGMTALSPRGRRRLVFGFLAAATLSVGLGTFRIASQEEFRSYAEYRTPLAEHDYLEVARISVIHYVEVVAENAVLTYSLAENQQIETKFGSTYFSVLLSALPGEQLTLDREIRLASNSSFIGGGVPPTLAGEGFVNLGWAGVLLVPLVLSWALTVFYRQAARARERAPDSVEARLLTLRYCYLLTLACVAQVAGLAGASTFPLTAFVVLCVLIGSQRRVVKASARVGVPQ
ncbi:hypothetical protein [Streptomyces sp. NPDC005096]|uniref:hypothetical protein n=1 Tax=Streptomyces sp. NPDC005096 TaxID=3154559 RepID=UPI0033AF1464